MWNLIDENLMEFELNLTFNILFDLRFYKDSKFHTGLEKLMLLITPRMKFVKFQKLVYNLKSSKWIPVKFHIRITVDNINTGSLYILQVQSNEPSKLSTSVKEKLQGQANVFQNSWIEEHFNPTLL